MGLHFPVNRAEAEPRSESGSGRLGSLAEATSIPRLDLVAQRRTLAKADGRVTVSGGVAAVLDRFDGGSGKAGRREFAADPCRVVIAVRRSLEEARCGAREEGGDSFRYHRRELVLLDAVPHAEHEATAGPQHPHGLAIRSYLAGKEHRTELTSHNIKRLIKKRQRQRIRAAPGDSRGARLRRREIEHRLESPGAARMRCRCRFL